MANRTSSSGRLGGIAAALVAVLIMIAARLYLGVLTPFELFFDWLLPRVPMSWFETGISTLGGYAKVLAYGTGIGTVLLLGGLAGTLYERTLSRRPSLSPWLLAGLYAAVLTASTVVLLVVTAGERSFTATLTVAALASAVFAAVLAALSWSSASAGGGGYDESRRALLRQIVYGTVGGVAALGLLSVVGRVLRQVTITDVGTDVAGMPEPFTPVDEFYVVSKNAIDPRVDAAAWKLGVGGMVQKPFELTLERLRALPAVEQAQTLECISNPIGGNLIGNARWKGVRLRDLLERAGVREGAVDIKLTCADGYTESIPLEKAMEPGVVLAYEMNGEPLTHKHGAPARLLVPNIFGMKNTKWLQKIEAVAEDYQGYWQRQGWSDVAIIQTMSQIRVPGSATGPTAGEETAMGGIAFAGSRGLSKVEWSADGGESWNEARLLPEIGDFSWRLWEASWTPDKPGDVELRVRATDGEGNTQTAERRPTLPDGATGYHGIRVRVS